jgi:hypothetical protein
MKERLQQVLRWTLITCFWICALSIKINGKTLFTYGNDLLIQNRIVQALDDQVTEVWYRAKQAARTALSDDLPARASRR